MTRRLVIALGAVPLALVVTASAAWGFFSSQGAGNGTVMVGSLAAPTGVSATPTAGTVTIAWSGVTPPGTAALGYFVTRSPVPSGSEVRVHATLRGTERRPNGVLFRVGVEIEIRDHEKPALAGEVLYLAYE